MPAGMRRRLPDVCRNGARAPTRCTRRSRQCQERQRTTRCPIRRSVTDMSAVGQALLINVIVLFVVLEADIGPHRKIRWFRIAPPLVLARVIGPIYPKSLTTHGTGLYLELAGTAAGILLGLMATRLLHVYP